MQFVRSSDGLVVLDIQRDAYFCIYDPVDPGAVEYADRDAAWLGQLFASQGIASEAIRSAEAGPAPWRDTPASEAARLGLGDVGRFIVALAVAGALFRRLRFAGLLAHAQGPRFRPSRHPARLDHAMVAVRFERLCLWLPFRIQCLFRSFFLLHFLRLYRLRADWIFGAALFPFEAHCWIADGQTLVAERSDRILRFSVLLRLEAVSA